MRKLLKTIKRGSDRATLAATGAIPCFTPEDVNVKSIRERTGLTQSQFAATFGISLGTLRHWERGDRKPHGPALVLLNAANNAPDLLLKILSGKTFAGSRTMKAAPCKVQL